MGGVHVNAKHFAKERICILAVAEWVAAASSIPESNVEETVLAKRETTSVVVRKWLVDSEENVFCARISGIGIGRGNCKFGNNGLELRAIVTGVVHVEAAIGRIVEVKSDTEQASLPAGCEAEAAGDIQERSGGARAVALDDLDVAALFDNKKPAATVIRLLDIERIRKARSDLD